MSSNPPQSPNQNEWLKLWPYLTEQERERLLLLIAPRTTKYIPHRPTERQAEFLRLECREAFYGGAAGGGKSDALLMAALQYVDIPGYAAILFRLTHTDLALEGALMERADTWLAGTDARWNGQDKRWTFPSGATLTFGYMESEKDKFRYKSAEFQFIGFDELTQFTETKYKFMFSRLRRLKGVTIPLRVRSASNPGDVGHDWVKERFLESASEDRVFVPARIDDNPHLDRAEYVKSLDELDPITRAQMLEGDWNVYEGGMFRKEWFPIVDAAPAMGSRVRSWDKGGGGDKSDPTAGVRMMRDEYGVFYIEDIVRGKWRSHEREVMIKQVAATDREEINDTYTITLQQDPGQAGKADIEYSLKTLAGYHVEHKPPTGEKKVRASPLASQAEAGNVKLVRGPWNKAFLDEIGLFPFGANDDQVDAASDALNYLAMACPFTFSGAPIEESVSHRPPAGAFMAGDVEDIMKMRF